jgi:hypothetical protein
LAKDDSHSCIGDVNYSDAGLVNIDDLIESLIELREKDLTMLHVIGIVITQNLRFMVNFRKSTDDEVKVEEDKVKSKTIC